MKYLLTLLFSLGIVIGLVLGLMWSTYNSAYRLNTPKSVYLPEEISEGIEGQLLQIDSVGVDEIHIGFKPILKP